MKINMAQTAVLICIACATAYIGKAHADWKPEGTVEVLVGTSPGGAHDRTARLIQALWQKSGALPVPFVVSNKPGGGGTRAWAQLNLTVGNPHYLAIMGPTLVTNSIMGMTPLTYAHFTQIAILNKEAIAFAVPADSPIRDGKELVGMLVKNPSALTVGIATARGNYNHIAVASVTKAGGGDPRKLRVAIFDSGGKVSVALMGGHVDVVAANASSLIAQAQKAKTGGLRLIAVSTPDRVPGPLANVPTWRELGVNSVVANFRGVMGPKELTVDQITYWEQAFDRLTGQDDWKREVEKNCGFGNFMNGAATMEFFKAESVEVRAALQSLELAK